MTAEVLEAPVIAPTEFYDSVRPELIPSDAHYAALYADGEFAVKSGTDIRRFTHRRWITVTGELHHVGIADYEYPNPAFTVPGRLNNWAAMRDHLYGVPAIVYSDMTDVSRAVRELKDTSVIWWIATRDRGKLTPEEICTLLRNEFAAVLKPADIWAQQYTDHSGEYDVSQLFGKWYH